jgi:hypothetical protein
VVLEEHGLDLTRGGRHYLITSEAIAEESAGLREFERLTNGGVGLAEAASDQCPSGMEILSTSVYVRTSQPDALASRINSFLRSDRSEAKRLRRQLDSVPTGDERHAFLVFDFTDPEFHSCRNGASTTSLRYPWICRRWWTASGFVQVMEIGSGASIPPVGGKLMRLANDH